MLGLAAIVVIGALGSLGDSADEASTEAGGETTAGETSAEDDRDTPSPTASDSPTPEPEPEPDPVAVPEVTGLAQAEAIDAIEAAGLQARVEEQEVTDAEEQSVVLDQRPAAGAELEPDATVSLTVGGEVVWADPITLTGSSDDVVDVDVPDDQVAIARIHHDGGGNFAVWSYDEDGNRIDLLVNDVGPYEGRVRWPGGIVVLDITAGGPWSLAIE